MILKTLTRAEAKDAMERWRANKLELPSIESDYIKIREELQRFNKKVRTDCLTRKVKQDYYIDVHFGLLVYEYLGRVIGFNLRTAANDNFWRYLSVNVVPDIVAERWGEDNDEHYWSKPARIWLRSIWWYVHLAWQGDATTTAKVLDSPCFSTDSILNLEERTGRKGTYIDVYRYIMYFYSHISLARIEDFNSGKKNRHETLFRAVMKLHTAKSIVVNPTLSLGGDKEYVRNLFLDLGVKV